jgi:hypothetical protein
LPTTTRADEMPRGTLIASEIDRTARYRAANRDRTGNGAVVTPFYPLESTPGMDPAPTVPSPEEILEAEDLLHRLEARLLKPPPVDPAVAASTLDSE